MKKSTTILVLLSFIFFTCRKEENNFGLPPATQQGANTFGCLIDGKPWVAEIGLGVFDPLIRKTEATYDEVGVGVADISYFYLSATFVSLPDSVYNAFRFNIRPIYATGIIDFSNVERKDIKCIFSQPGIATHTSIYLLDTLYPINMNISKLDTKANICAGTFEFRLINKAKKDTLNVTNGRFDVIYQPD